MKNKEETKYKKRTRYKTKYQKHCKPEDAKQLAVVQIIFFKKKEKCQAVVGGFLWWLLCRCQVFLPAPRNVLW